MVLYYTFASLILDLVFGRFHGPRRGLHVFGTVDVGRNGSYNKQGLGPQWNF